MNQEEIDDFREDAQEGQIVTLLLHDMTQEIGKVIKTRASYVKIEINGLVVHINYEDIKRIAFGVYNFLRSSPASGGSEPSQQAWRPVIQNVLQPVPVAPVSPTPINKETILSKSILDFEICMKKAALPPIEPNFSFVAAKYSYSTEKEIRNILATAKQKFERIQHGDNKEIWAITAWIEERMAKHNNVSELPSLVGSLYYKGALIAQALPFFKAAVHISHCSSDWRSLAIAAVDNGEMSFYAWNKYFELVTSFGVEENYWIFYTRSILGSHSEYSAIKQIADIYVKFTDKHKIMPVLNSLVYILDKMDKKEYAEELALSLHKNETNNIDQVVNKIFNNFNSIPEHEIIIQNERKYDIINNYEKVFNIMSDINRQNQSNTIYNSDDNISTSYTGYVTEFSPIKRGGYIKRENSDEIFFFYLDHVEDANARSNIQKGIYTDKFQFFTFTNDQNLKQAKKIQLCCPYTSNDLENNDRAFEKRAKNAILSGKRDAAINIYREGLKLAANKSSTVLWVGLAQQLSATGQYADAAQAYKQLIKVEKRPAAQKHANIKYVQALAKAGQTSLAENEIKKLLKENPHDAYLNTLLDNIHPEDLDDGDENSLADWGKNINFENSSAFLKRELESTDFIDNEISKRGGEPTPEDADRLMKESMKPDMSPDTRYIISLQAAKAYSLLPTSYYYARDDYDLSISNYAMQKGEALVNRMLGLASNQTRIANAQQTLQKLHDSAISYFIEALDRMPAKVVEQHAPVILKNYLLAELLNFYANTPDMPDDKLLHISHYVLLFKAITRQNTKIVQIACDALITWGSYPRVWQRLSSMLDQLGIFYKTAAQERFRKTMKEKIISFVGDHVENYGFRGILKEGFNYLLEERANLTKHFNRINDIRQTNTFEFFQKIKTPLENFPLHNSALLASDVRVIERLQKIIKDMMGYMQASDSERADMLVRARQALNDPERPCLMREITDAPTYWKRVGCEPIIRNLLKCIAAMENIRMKDRAPKIEIRLEPPLFRKAQDNYITSARLTNKGIASATEINVELKLKDNQGAAIPLPSIKIDRIEAGKSREEKLVIPAQDENREIIGSILKVKAAFLEGVSDEFEFTVAEDCGCGFNWNSIPWDPMREANEANFKGRDGILNTLENCLSSDSDRVFTNMLYGVTRSGKTSILKFLRQRMHTKNVANDSLGRRFYCVDWKFQLSANWTNSHTVWKHLIYDQVQPDQNDPCIPETIKDDITNILNSVMPDPDIIEADHFLPLVEAMKAAAWYPLFLIDEFSFFSGLYQKGFLGSAFLALLRELALRKDAAFVLAGTYDILELISNPLYGISGQFVNLRKVLVTKIDEQSAAELVDIFKEHLQFTDAARDLILTLSGCRPFLIQFLCMNCARFAFNEKRSLLGVPEVNRVAMMMTGSIDIAGEVARLETNNFDNNLIFAKEDMNLIFSFITTLLALEGNPESGFLSHSQIAAVWKERGYDAAKLSEGIKAMQEREIIEPLVFEGMNGYRLTVELFRLWWANRHPSLDRELDAIPAEYKSR